MGVLGVELQFKFTQNKAKLKQIAYISLTKHIKINKKNKLIKWGKIIVCKIPK